MFQVLALLALTLTALTLGWLRSADFQDLATQRAVEIIETALGEQASLAHVSVQFWPPGLQAEGFRVQSRATGETIMSADRIGVPVTLTATGPRIGRLSLERPRVHVHFDQGGQLVEFRDRMTSGNPLRRLPWSSLRVSEGELLVEHPRAALHLTGLAVVPSGGAVGDVSGRLAVTVFDPWSNAADRRSITDTSDFSWSAVQIGPTEVVVPSLALHGSILELAGTARVPLDDDLDIDLNGDLTLDDLIPLFEPPRAGHGQLGFAVEVNGRGPATRVRVTARGEHLGLDMPGKFTPVLTYDLDTMSFIAVAHKDGIEVEKLIAPWAGGQIVATGHITPDRRLENGTVEAEAVHLAPLLRAFDAAPNPWVDLVGRGTVQWAGTLEPLRLEGTFEVDAEDWRVADRPIDRATGEDLLLHIPTADARGSLVLERTHVVLDCDRVRTPRSEATAIIDLGLLARGPLHMDFDLHRANLEDFAPLNEVGLKGRGRIQGRIDGPFNALVFDGAGAVQDFGILGIHYADSLSAKLHSPDMRSIELHQALALLGDSRYGGSYRIDFNRRAPEDLVLEYGLSAPPKSTIVMETDITIDRGRVEDLIHMFVDVDGLTGDLTGKLRLRGPLYDMSGGAELAVTNATVYGEKFPEGEGHGYMDRGLFTLDRLKLRRDDGRAGLTLRGDVKREWKLNMELVADGFELAKLDGLASPDPKKRTKFSGRLGGLVWIGNTLFDPAPSGRLTLRNLRYAGGEPVGDSTIAFETRDGVLRITSGALLGGRANVTGTVDLWKTQDYSLAATLDRVPADLLYPLAADGQPISANVSGNLTVAGAYGVGQAPVNVAAHLSHVEVAYDAHLLRNGSPWSFLLDGDHFEVQGFDLAGGNTHLTLDGSGPNPWRDPSRLGAVPPTDLRGGGNLDLDLLRAVVPGLQKAVGAAEVQISALGTRPDVEAVVDVNIACPLFRHESAPLTFEDSEARLQLTKDQIRFLALGGGVGGGRFTGGGTIDTKNWLPVRWNLAMDVTDASVQWIESLPPAVGNGRFQFDGPADSLLLSGNVDITEMNWTDRIDWEDYVVEFRSWMLVDSTTNANEPPLFSFDIGIESDRTIQVRNNLAEAQASANLRVIGDTNRPGLTGSVNIHNGGLAFLQDREFRVERGNMSFDDAWTWDPRLDFSLVTDITSNEQRYTVDYQVMGPFSNWYTVTRADPWLPQSDINALLWFGVTMDDLQEMGALPYALALGVGDLLVTDLIVSGQAGVPTELPDFLPDRIDLATGVNARGQYSPDPRLILQKRIGDFGGVDLTWEMNVLRPQDNYATARVRIGGLWSLSAWYATLQRDRVLPIGGAYGADLLVRWEFE